MVSDEHWHLARESPTLAAGAVHVWRIVLRQSASTMERLAGYLDDDERGRAARFAFARDRERFLVAHGALREVLGGYLRCAPEAVTFRVSAQGKPEIAAPESNAEAALRFNLAHSGEIALVSVTRIGATGVDVEQMRGDVEALAIAERFFAPEECDALHSQIEDQRAGYFYRLWTCKEAYLKAVGVGLTAPLHQIQIRLGAAGGVTIVVEGVDVESVSRWSLMELAAGEGYAGALAVEGDIETVALREWDGSQR